MQIKVFLKNCRHLTSHLKSQKVSEYRVHAVVQVPRLCFSALPSTISQHRFSSWLQDGGCGSKLSSSDGLRRKGSLWGKSSTLCDSSCEGKHAFPRSSRQNFSYTSGPKWDHLLTLLQARLTKPQSLLR